MPPTPRPFRSGLRRVVASLLALATMAGFAYGVRVYNTPAPPNLAHLSLATARRADLRGLLRAGGRTESVQSTIIDCQLERLEMRSEGRSTVSGGASTILTVIDEGSWVKKDDILCTLDSSEYLELVRQQEIKVDRARADLQEATLDLESAEIGVKEFRDGLVASTVQNYEGQLKLAQSDRQRAEDRLAWSTRMLGKGYVAGDQVSNDRQSLRKAELAITKAQWALDNFRKFGVPMEIRSLESQFAAAQAQLIYQQRKFDRFVERLDYYRLMVENCTIKAPHDGYLIYAKPSNPWLSTAKIEPGATVRQMQSLFILPDLSRMQVITALHESVVDKVRPGMTVKAKIEGLANRMLEGHVVKVDPLPDLSIGFLSDTKYFNATIRLDSAPRDIRPSMTAEVEIDLGRRENVVTIPPEALAYEDGEDVCYVAVEGGAIERRSVKVGQSNRELLEVTGGVDEGEQVVADLSHIAEFTPLIVDLRHQAIPAHHDPAPIHAGL